MVDLTKPVKMLYKISNGEKEWPSNIITSFDEYSFNDLVDWIKRDYKDSIGIEIADNECVKVINQNGIIETFWLIDERKEGKNE